MLQIETGAPFAKQLLERLVQVFGLQAAVLYERDSGDFSCVGTASPEGIQNALRSAAVSGGTSPQDKPPFVIVAVSRGSEPVASMALRGATMPAGVLQGIANLVAIGLERARAQDLAQQIEATRQSEQLRTTLIDAVAHEFKTHVATVLTQRKRRSDAGTEVGPAGDFGLQFGRKRTESGLSSFVGCASLTTGFPFASKETDTPPIRRPRSLDLEF